MSDSEPEVVATGSRFAANTLYVFAGQLVGKLASFAFFIVVARILGVREYGYFNFAVSFVPIFLIFGTLGIDLTMVREVARDKSRLSELFASGLVTRLTMGGLGLLASFAVGIFFVENVAAFMTLLFIGFALLVDELTSFFTAVFRAFERMGFNALSLVINRIVSTALAVTVLILGGGLTLVVVAYLTGSFASLLFAWWVMARHFPPTRMRDARRAVARELFDKSKEIGASGLINMALFRIDAVMVQGISGAAAVGLYGAAYRFFESFLFVAWSVMSVALPRVAKQGIGRASERTFELIIAMALAFYLPIAVGAPFVNEWLVENLFGARYLRASEAIPWLTAAGVFYSIAYISRVTAIGLGDRSALLRTAIITLSFNVGLNAYLIPKEGFVGAAIATCLAEVLEAGLLLHALRKTGLRFGAARLPLVPVAASGAMAVVLVTAGLEDLTALVAGAVTYCAGLFIFARLLAPESARRTLDLIRRRSP